MDKRNYAIDLLRLITSIGVIALHVRVDTEGAAAINKIFWPICVPFFYLASLTYFINNLHFVSIDKQYRKAWQRLIVPYLAWTIIYLSLLATKRAFTGAENQFTFWREFFYGESAVHLYFIPTLIFLQTVAAAAFLLVNKPQRRATGTILLLSAVIYFIIGVRYRCFGIGSIGNLWAIGIYVSTAFFMSSLIRKNRIPHTSLLVIGTLITSTVIAANFLGERLVIGGYPLILPLGGVGLFLFGTGIKIQKIPKKLFVFTQYSYGIYLAHVMVLELFEFCLEKLSDRPLIYDLGTKLIVVTLAFGITSIIVFFVKRLPVASQLLLGEKKNSSAGIFG